MVEPLVGALNHTSSEPLCGAGVAPLGVGVGLGVGVAFCTFTVMTSRRKLPERSYAVATSWCVPFANFVVSMAHCMPSAGVVSVLSAVESIVNATRATLPEALT